MANITDLVDYYTNLLIIQYNNKPKARATVELLVREGLANGLLRDVNTAFNLDTAVGEQLDWLGKYIGADRFYNVTDPENYFAFTDYNEVDPDLNDKYGFNTYATYDDDNANGWLNYDTVVTVGNALNDDDYRFILKMKIIQNTSNHSHKSIDDNIFALFGAEVRPSSAGDMDMFYFINSERKSIILAAIDKEILPRPMGVRLRTIQDVIVPFFGMATYTNTPTSIVGYQTYANYGTVDGEVLTYDRIDV